MSHETPGIRWFASELIHHAWRQALGESRRSWTAGGKFLSLRERGAIAAWLASAESQTWWHVLEDVHQSRALAQDAYFEAVEEILELDADPAHVGDLDAGDRELLTEALHVLGVLREREREGVPPPRGEAWKHLLESAAEGEEVSERELDGDEMVRLGAEIFRENPDLTSSEVYDALQEKGQPNLKRQSWSAGGYATRARRLAEEEPETEEPAPQAADTPREESPSRPESGEGGTDSVSEEQPESPSVELEETGSTPGGEEPDVVNVKLLDENGDLVRVVQQIRRRAESSRPGSNRPTIVLENGQQHFVASRNGGEKWDLELRVEGVDPEVAENLHDVAFSLLFPRVREEEEVAS